MTGLQERIRSLPEDEAITLLRRLALALRTGPKAPAITQQEVRALASRLSLVAEPTAAITEGNLARSALMLMAADSRYAPSIESLMQSPRVTFSSGAEDVDAADLLTILQTQHPDASGEFVLPMPSGSVEQHGLLRALTRQLLGKLGMQPDGMQADAEYRVWFATSRQPVNAADLSQGFGVTRGAQIHFGHCDVFIPRSHKVGSTGSGWWKRTISRQDDRLKLLATESLAEETFWLQLKQQLAASAHDDCDAVVFIHGYNVNFDQAALRTAQIGFDLQVRGAMAFYSWASRGETYAYTADEAAIELDETPIADFLCNLALRSGARKVHVIAHSMGNRAALRAMERITLQAEARSGVRFGQIILAAADVDARRFLQACEAYPKLSDRTTLYVSTTDLAVEASRWLHDFPRAGLMPPVTIAPGIDTVNATNTDLTLLGHGYVAEAREVISDIHALIRYGAAPQHRLGLRSVATPEGAAYWLISA